jgi:hypothetical protein
MGNQLPETGLKGAIPGQMKLSSILLAGTVLAAAVITTTGQTTASKFTAVTQNISGARDAIRIELLRWSTDAERDQLLAAWALKAAPAGAGRGAATRAAPEEGDPAQSAVANPSPPAAGGRGRGGRGGRGAAEAPPLTPEASLAAALGNAPTVGYLWSSEVAGYSLRYAVRLADAGGGTRIILITDRRLGATNDLWKPAGTDAVASYDFSVIELHLNSKGEGEGKTSLTGKVAVVSANSGSAAKTFALENYSALPVVLANVRGK